MHAYETAADDQTTPYLLQSLRERAGVEVIEDLGRDHEIELALGQRLRDLPDDYADVRMLTERGERLACGRRREVNRRQ